MSDQEHSTKHIFQSLAVNMIIAATKGVVAVFTKSGAMLAEAIHSSADCLNQLLLLVGVKQSRQKPDALHPLGYGRATYFWSFLVALMLFTGGGVFSIYEGIHKIHEPEAVERVWLGIGILVFSLLLEGWSTFSNIRDLNQKRGATPFFEYLRTTKDADLVVIFGENAAASLGLLFALAALVLAATTGDGRWDGVGSLLVGLVLVAVAIFLAVEVKSLLLGESADPEVEKAVRQVVSETEEVERILSLITLQQGQGEVLVAVKLAFAYKLDIDAACATINAFEARLRQLRPEVRWCFVEPDIPRVAPSLRGAEKGASASA